MITRKNIEWKDIPTCEGIFKISNYGDIRCLGYIDKAGRHHLPFERRVEDNKAINSGYYLACTKGLSLNESFVHRLVAITYLGIYPGKDQVNHKDGNKRNNFAGTKANAYADGNLEWVTRAENMAHASQNGLLNRQSESRKAAIRVNRKIAVENAKKPVIQLDMNGRTIATYPSTKEAAKATGIPSALISSIASGKSYHKSAHGFQWIYKSLYDPQKDYAYKPSQFECAKRGVGQCDQSGNLLAVYPSRKAAAKAIGSPSGDSYIGECCLGKRPQYKGFIWKNR